MTIEVAAIGGFHVGGREVRLEGLPVRHARFAVGGPEKVVDPNGAFEAEQMYVQYVRLASPTAPWPLLLWHGGGQTGVTWEDTPDGRPGWQMRFLEAGWDVYVSDAVERGRAGWARFPEIFPTEPVFREKRQAWELFRVGPPGSWADEPEARRPFPGTRFPWRAYDRFFKQTVPRWAGHEAITQRAYDALVGAVGPCAIMAHSQGGAFAMQAALAAPETVRAVIAIEPSGVPDPGAVDPARVRDVPHLVVWGDFIAGDAAWTDNRARVARYWEALARAGGRAEVLDLPAEGIHGNSHFPMMDDNSDAVAALVERWLRGLAG
jgi:pimeloyl-ACP methyl ester carboxylesterase